MTNIKGWLTGGTLAAALMMGSMVVKADPGVIYGNASGSDDTQQCVANSGTDDGVIYGGVIYGVANGGVIYGLDGVIYGVVDGVIYGSTDTCPAP